MLPGSRRPCSVGWVAQFTQQGVHELFADPLLAPYQPVFAQLRELACPWCNAWVFNSLVSPDGSATAKWHKDDTFRETAIGM